MKQNLRNIFSRADDIGELIMNNLSDSNPIWAAYYLGKLEDLISEIKQEILVEGEAKVNRLDNTDLVWKDEMDTFSEDLK